MLASSQAIGQTPIIVDTDIGSDGGDLSAIALTCIAHKMGLVKIEAFTSCSRRYGGFCTGTGPVTAGVGYCKMLCDYYGITPEFGYGNEDYVCAFLNVQDYSAVSNSPIPLSYSTNFPSSVKTIRTVLKNRANVQIVTIGQLNDLAYLLQSPGDGISPLTGWQLVSNSCSRIVTMGGQYPNGSEFNFYTDSPRAAYAVANVPTNVPVVFVGFEAGNNIYDLNGSWLNQMAQTNPVYMVFTNLYGSSGRPAWDSLACFYALCGVDTNSWFSRVQGSNYVNAAYGTNQFTAGTGPGYKDFYLTIDPTNYAPLSTMINRLITGQPSAVPPVALIEDCDVGSDGGDLAAAALTIVGRLKGLARLEAVTGCCRPVTFPWFTPPNAPAAGVGYFKMLCDYYGIYPEYGFGNNTNLAAYVGPQQYSAVSNSPIPLTYATNFPPAYKVMRSVLQNRRGVQIVTHGQLNNVADLLASPVDEISPLSGFQLVSNSVNRLVVMGGQYPSGQEFNFYTDPASAAYVVTHTPTNVPIVFVGFEAANNIYDLNGSWLTQLPPANPVYMVFTNLYGSSGRPSWDSLTCLYALYGIDTNSWFNRVQGSNYVDAASGANQFTAGTGPGYKDFYLKIDPTNAAALTTALNNLLVAQPPPPGPRVNRPGLLNNQLGFTITGATNQLVAVQASTNLVNPSWPLVQICTLTNGSIYFGDSQWSSYPARFYHVRSP